MANNTPYSQQTPSRQTHINNVPMGALDPPALPAAARYRANMVAGTPPTPSPAPQPQWAGGNIPIVGGLGDTIGGGIGAVGNQVSQVQGEVKQIVSFLNSMGGLVQTLPQLLRRMALTGLFAIAAMGLLFIVLRSLLEGSGGSSGGGRSRIGRAAFAAAL